MRIERLDLESYGHLRDLTLDLSRPAAGLTVVLGPNEAGKSTTMRAIRSLLFGIERSPRDGYRTGREGLRIGARVVRSNGEALEVVRQGLSKAPLVDRNGAPVDQATWAAVLGNAERSLFTNLFCIDHHELHARSGDLLDADGDIGRLVFGAGLGAVALSDALKRLDQRADALYKPRGSTQRVHRGLTGYRDLMTRARDHRVRARDWERAEARLGEIESETATLSAARAERIAAKARLERIGNALSHLTRRTSAIRERDELLSQGRVGSAAWAGEVASALVAAQTAERARREAERERDRLRERLAELKLPGPVLERADAIDGLIEGTERYRKDTGDLPRVRAELEMRQQAVREILERLGMSEDAARAITDAQLLAIERLAHAHVGLAANLEQAERLVDGATRDIAEARRAVDHAAAPRDVRILTAALEAARPLVDSAAGLMGLAAELDVLRGDIASAAGRLGVAGRDPSDLEALGIPSRSLVITANDRRGDLLAKLAAADDRRTEIAGRVQEIEGEHRDLLARPGMPDAEELDVARRHRDEGWARVRAVWLGAEATDDAAGWPPDSTDLAGAYTAAVDAADDAADRRFRSAEDMTKLAAFDAELVRLGHTDTELSEREREVGDELGDAERAWTAVWQRVGIVAGTPEEMLEWLEGFRDLRDKVRTARERGAAMDALGGEIATASAAIVDAVTALGDVPVGEPLEMLVRQGDGIVETEGAHEHARHEAARAVEHHERALRQRVAERDAYDSAMATWTSEWLPAIACLGGHDAVGPAGASRLASLLRDLRGEVRESANLGRRVGGIERDTTTYREHVRAVAAETLGSDGPEDPVAAVDAMRARLLDARSVADRRGTIEDELEAATDRHRTSMDEVTESSAALERLRVSAGFGVGDDLRATAERSLAVASADEAIAGCDRTLLELGRGRTVEELDADAREFDHDSDRVDAAVREVDDRIADLTTQIDDANRRLGDARTALGAIDGSDEAAAVEQEGELVLAGLAGDVRDFVETSLAAAVLRSAIADYGEAHQGPILDRAGRHFRLLTGDAFVRLSVDVADGATVLLAQRANGETLHVHDLSDGTVDQLYLALRLAGIEHHVEAVTEPLPVVLDDLLVNFDDARTATALTALAALGAQTQTLLFTHHPRIAELAARSIPAERLSVVELPARDHSTPVPPADVATDRRRGAGHGGDHYGTTIISVLESAGRPLGKSDILARADVPETAWTGAIKRLVDRGDLIQEGEKRGARYRLAAAASPGR